MLIVAYSNTFETGFGHLKKTLFSTTEFFNNASVYGWVKTDSQNKYSGGHLFLYRQKWFMERLTSQRSCTDFSTKFGISTKQNEQMQNVN